MPNSLKAKAAYITLRYYNPNMLIGPEGSELMAGIEDHHDPDGRIYRLEYVCTLDGQHANAYVRSNPWDRNCPKAGTSEYITHVYSDGYICMGDNMTRTTKDSPFKLDAVIKRTRFWCIAFSAYKESGDSSVFKV